MTEKSKMRPISTLYSMLGWSIIPVSQKYPLVRWKEYSKRHATADEVREWIERFGDVGIGVVTGSISRLLVLDADGAEAVAECEELGVVKTPTVLTSRGKHYYFQLPKNISYKNAAKLGTSKHIDVRCEGGFVVAPYTKRKDGGRYEWEIRPDKALIAKAPNWLLDMLKIKVCGEDKLNDSSGDVTCDGSVGSGDGSNCDINDRQRNTWVGALPSFLQELVFQQPVKGTRSDNDFAVVLALLANGASEDAIREVFKTHPIGQKYREQGDRYLLRTIDEAIEKLRLVTVKYADIQTYGEAASPGKAPGARLHLALEVEDESERGRLIRYGLTVPGDYEGAYRARWDKLFEAVDMTAPASLEETASVRKALIGKKMRVLLKGSGGVIAGVYRV